MSQYVELPGSIRTSMPLDGVPMLADPDREISVTIEIARRRLGEGEQPPPFPMTLRQANDYYGPDPQALHDVISHVQDAGLRVLADASGDKFLEVAGKIRDFETFFGVEIFDAKMDGNTFRYRVGSIFVNESLVGKIIGVYGLDDRPMLRPHIAFSAPVRTKSMLLTMQAIAAKHQFPLGDGDGAVIALLEFGGGFNVQDVRSARGGGAGTGEVSVKHDSIGQTPGDSVEHAECALDIQVVAALAPKAAINLYFGKKSAQSLVNLLELAIKDQPTVIAISWGAPEKPWPDSYKRSINELFAKAAGMGIVCLASSGDFGSQPAGFQPEFPASAPNVTACGGYMMSGPDTVVWRKDDPIRASGGGFSTCSDFRRPSYQSALDMPQNEHNMRGVPDISAYASEKPGYPIFLQGGMRECGATSAAPPLLAALIARIAGRKVFAFGTGKVFNDLLYSFAPITFGTCEIGNNNLGTNAAKFSASAGWDPCTGLGTIKGAALAAALEPFLRSRP